MIKNRLQIFAEGEGVGAAAEPASNGTGTSETTKPMSFDDFLKTGDNQAEFDRRITKAIQTAVSNAEQKWKTLSDNRVSEAEKLAQMTNEEKEKYRADKAEKELADLKRQIALGEMSKTARKLLSDENIAIPDEIVANLVTDDAEATKTAVQQFAKIFKEAVQSGIKEALKGNPPKAGGEPPKITKKEILEIKDRGERQRLMAENPELFIRR